MILIVRLVVSPINPINFFILYFSFPHLERRDKLTDTKNFIILMSQSDPFIIIIILI